MTNLPVRFAGNEEKLERLFRAATAASSDAAPFSRGIECTFGERILFLAWEEFTAARTPRYGDGRQNWIVSTSTGTKVEADLFSLRPSPATCDPRTLGNPITVRKGTITMAALGIVAGFESSSTVRPAELFLRFSSLEDALVSLFEEDPTSALESDTWRNYTDIVAALGFISDLWKHSRAPFATVAAARGLPYGSYSEDAARVPKALSETLHLFRASLRANPLATLFLSGFLAVSTAGGEFVVGLNPLLFVPRLAESLTGRRPLEAYLDDSHASEENEPSHQPTPEEPKSAVPPEADVSKASPLSFSGPFDPQRFALALWQKALN